MRRWICRVISSSGSGARVARLWGMIIGRRGRGWWRWGWGKRRCCGGIGFETRRFRVSGFRIRRSEVGFPKPFGALRLRLNGTLRGLRRAVVGLAVGRCGLLRATFGGFWQALLEAVLATRADNV